MEFSAENSAVLIDLAKTRPDSSANSATSVPGRFLLPAVAIIRVSCLLLLMPFPTSRWGHEVAPRVAG